MRTKYTYLTTAFFLLLTLINFPALYAQENQMPARDSVQQTNDELPVTTTSAEARQNYLQAIKLMENAQLDKARLMFEAAVKADPDFAMAHMGLGITGTNYNESKEHFDKAESLAGSATDGEKQLLALAKAQFEGDDEKGKAAVQRLLSIYPDNKHINFLAGQYYFFIDGQRDQAITLLQNAVRRDENYAPAYNLLGYAYSDKDDFTNAENAFKKYISLMPDNPNPYDSYAELLLKNGRYDESIQQYEKALSIDPEFYSANEGIGHNYLFKGDFAKAREYYESTFSKAQTVNWKLTSLYNQAAAYVREKNFDKAVEVLEQRASLAEREGAIPAQINSHTLMGLVHNASGKMDEAKRHFDVAADRLNSASMAEELKNDLTSQLNLNRSYAMAGSAVSGNQQARTGETDEEVGSIGNTTDDKNSETLQGLAALNRNEYDEAISHLSKVENQSPLDWYYLSVAYRENGDEQKANEMVEKIRKSNQNSMELALAYAMVEQADTK